MTTIHRRFSGAAIVATVAVGGLLSAPGAVALTPSATSGSLGTTSVVAPQAVHAWVSSIEHNARRITVTGTAAGGQLVTASGAGLTSASTRAGFNGSFILTVEAEADGTYDVAVVAGDGAKTSVRATVQVDPKGALGIAWGLHDATLQNIGSWKPYSMIEVFLDGRTQGTTQADGSGRWAFQVTDVIYGTHRFEARSSYDGAVQWTGGADHTFTADPEVAAAVVDVERGVIRVSGTAPDDVELSFTHDVGPIETVDGAQSVPVVGGSWVAEVPVPLGDFRFWDLDITAHVSGIPVGSAVAKVTIPLPFVAQVDSCRPKRLTLSGSGEPAADIAFFDAAGAPILDRDGQPVTASVGRGGVWTRTLDPRLFDGGTVTAKATSVDGTQFVGAATITFR